jgi:hypothetical protein
MQPADLSLGTLRGKLAGLVYRRMTPAQVRWCSAWLLREPVLDAAVVARDLAARSAVWSEGALVSRLATGRAVVLHQGACEWCSRSDLDGATIEHVADALKIAGMCDMVDGLRRPIEYMSGARYVSLSRLETGEVLVVVD